MSTKQNPAVRLTNALDELEHLILESSDKEILEFARSDTASHAYTSVEKTSTLKQRGLASRARDVSFAGMPKEFADRVRFLKGLIASRNDVPPQMVSVFSADRRPSGDELDEVIQELINRGILKK